MRIKAQSQLKRQGTFNENTTLYGCSGTGVNVKWNNFLTGDRRVDRDSCVFDRTARKSQDTLSFERPALRCVYHPKCAVPRVRRAGFRLQLYRERDRCAPLHSA